MGGAASRAPRRRPLLPRSPGPLWKWFTAQGAGGGAAAMIDAWRQHPDLHAAGALMPLVLHLCGKELHGFVSAVLPRHLTSAPAYLSFCLDLLPLLASSPDARAYAAKSGTLKHIFQVALGVCRRPSTAASSPTAATESASTGGLEASGLATGAGLPSGEMKGLRNAGLTAASGGVLTFDLFALLPMVVR